MQLYNIINKFNFLFTFHCAKSSEYYTIVQVTKYYSLCIFKVEIYRILMLRLPHFTKGHGESMIGILLEVASSSLQVLR